MPVSQICKTIFSSPTSKGSLLVNSAPIVDVTSLKSSRFLNLFINEVFPTLLSPIRIAKEL